MKRLLWVGLHDLLCFIMMQIFMGCDAKALFADNRWMCAVCCYRANQLSSILNVNYTDYYQDVFIFLDIEV